MAPTVEDIVEILGNMQVEDAKNSDVLRAAFKDFKKLIDEKHSFTLDKFQELINSFSELSEKQAETSKTSELKSLFEVFQEHVNVISGDIKDQKTDLETIEKTIREVGEEKPDKKEFSENVEQVKDSIYAVIEKLDAYDEYVKRCTEDVSKKLEEVVTKDDNVELKAVVRELVQKTDNTIDALRFFNDKSENLASAIRELITSDDAIESAQKISQILEKTEDISAKMTYMPLKSDLENVSDKVNEISTHCSEKFDEINSGLQNFVQELSGLTQSGNEEIKQNLFDKFAELQTSVASVSSSFANQMESFKGKVSDCFSSISSFSDENVQKVNMSLTELVDIKNELSEIAGVVGSINSVTEAKSQETISIIEGNLVSLVSQLEFVKSGVERCIQTSALQASLDSITYRFDEITNLFDKVRDSVETSSKDLVSDVEEKLNGLKQEINLVNTDILQNVTSKNDEICASIQDLKNSLAEFPTNDFSQSFEELKAQIEMSFLNVGSDISSAASATNETVSTLDTTCKELHSLFLSFDEYIKNDIKNQLELLKFSLEGSSNNLEVHLLKSTEFIENWDNEVEKIKCFTEDIKAVLSTKLDDCCVDLKAYVDENDSTGETIRFIKDLKQTISDSFDGVLNSQDEFKNDIKDNFKAVIESQQDKTKEAEIIKEEVTNLGETLKDFVTEACENSLNKVDETIKNINAIGTMVDNNDEIVSVIDNIKNILSTEITSKLESYAIVQDEKLEKIKADIDSYLYTEQIEAEKAKILDELFALKKHSENNNELMNIVEHLEKRINSINAKNPVNEYVKSISELNKKAVFEELANIKNELEFYISDSQTALKETVASGFDGLSEKIENLAKSDENLAKTLEALHSKVDILALDDDEDFDIEGEIDDIKDLIMDLKLSESASHSAVMDECLNKLLNEMNSIRDDVPNKEVKESIITAIVSIFDQISFIEETEEIKDFVEEKTDEINEKLQQVHAQLQFLATGESSEYTYTMQDVESDIAKLRLAMNEITNSAPQQTLVELRDNIEKIVTSVEHMQSSLSEDEIVDLKNDFVKLSEDMVSISSRTNKLLLTSDESYKALSDGLDRFGGLIYKLEDKIQFPDTTEINERIEQKVDALNVTINNSLANDEIFHQVLQYLGEWMDSVSESINSISEKTSDIARIKDITEELKFAAPQKTEIIEELEHRFESQELRMDRLEMKLDNILMAIEEKSDSLVSKKLDKLEKQIAKLGINVEKLTSYVDEE